MLRIGFWTATLLLSVMLRPTLAQDKPAAKPEKTTVGKMPNASVVANLFCGGQPSPEDLQAAKERGIKAVLNLREAPELEFNEAETVRKLGMQYYHVPFQGADKLTDDVFDKVRAILKNKEARPLLIHCHAANRVGAVWLAHRVLDEGVDFEQAVQEAKSIGLKTPAYIDKAKAYIARRRTGGQEPKKPATPPNVVGAWTGTWGPYTPQPAAQSGKSLEMRLDCDVVHKDATWQATFEGECGRPYKYTIKMEGRQAGGAVLFKGTTDLGEKDGGVYDWIGRATDTEFFGFYTSAKYTGVFRLTRKK